MICAVAIVLALWLRRAAPNWRRPSRYSLARNVLLYLLDDYSWREHERLILRHRGCDGGTVELWQHIENPSRSAGLWPSPHECPYPGRHYGERAWPCRLRSSSGSIAYVTSSTIGAAPS